MEGEKKWSNTGISFDTNNVICICKSHDRKSKLLRKPVCRLCEIIKEGKKPLGLGGVTE